MEFEQEIRELIKEADDFRMEIRIREFDSKPTSSIEKKLERNENKQRKLINKNREKAEKLGLLDGSED